AGDSVGLVGSPLGGTFSGTGVSGSTFDSAGLGSGDYTVTYEYTDDNGCTNSAEATVTVNALPDVTADNASVCAGDSVDLVGSPLGGTFSGMGVSGSTFDSTGLAEGDYTITYEYTDNNGCTNSAEATVTVSPPVMVKIICDIAVCEGGVLQLAAQGIGGTGQYTFTWGPPEFTQYISDTTIGAPTFSGAPVGEYLLNVFVTDEAGCVSDSAEILITVLENPTVTVTADAPELCIGESTTITANPDPAEDDDTDYTYEWTVPDGVSDPGNVAEFDTSVPGTYTVKITDVQATIEDITAGCMAEGSITITPIGTNEAPIVTPTNYCEGNPPAATLEGFASTTVPGGTIVWFEIVDGEAVQLPGPPASPTEPGEYSYLVRIATDDGCISVASSIAQFTVFANPILSATATNVSCNGQADGTIEVETNSDSYTITLNGGDDTDLSDQTEFGPGTYTITASSSAGNSDIVCTSSTEITIEEPIAVTLEAVATDVTCFDEADGTIEVSNVSEGATVTITLNGGDDTDLSGQSTFDVGTYTVTATAPGGNDGDSCTLSIEVTISQPPMLEITDVQDETLGSCLTQEAVNSAFQDFLDSFGFTPGSEGASGSFEETYSAPPACGGFVDVVYNASDLCEQLQDVARFTVTADTEIPLISVVSNENPEGACNPNDIVAPTFSASDNCGVGAVDVVEGAVSIEGCLYSQTWTANVNDNCGNPADEVSVTYTWIVDTDKPVITSSVEGGDLGCNPTAIPMPEFTL
ncbi:hypothetical protein, partial [Winogradskyella maritima]